MPHNHVFAKCAHNKQHFLSFCSVFGLHQLRNKLLNQNNELKDYKADAHVEN